MWIFIWIWYYSMNSLILVLVRVNGENIIMFMMVLCDYGESFLWVSFMGKVYIYFIVCWGEELLF